MLSLPAKGAICRMRMTGHEDPNFRWHIGDLNDMVLLPHVKMPRSGASLPHGWMPASGPGC
jgi:hypothetical protein